MARIRKSVKPDNGKIQAVWRVGGYIRLSREDGADESLSVVNQKKIIEEYFLECLDADAVFVGSYVDDGMTGTDYDRPEFQRLMSDIENGSVNCVVCKTLSRAFRNYSDQGYFLENFFPKNKTRFISIGSPAIDSFLNPDIISGLEVPITGLMNDRFAGKTSEDVRRTFNHKRKNGLFIGAFAPFGYAKDPNDKNKLVIDDAAADVVRDIFSLFVNMGYSLGGITRYLNERGIPNPTKYKRENGLNYHNSSSHLNDGLWSATVIRGMLKNKVYIGHMVQGRQKVVSYKVHDRVAMPEEEWFIKENTHAPIVTVDMFEKADALLLRDMRTPNQSHTVHLLSGYVRCFDCGKALVRHPARDRVYYMCCTYKRKSKAHCTKHSIREDILITAVLEAIKMQIHVVDKLVSVPNQINSGTGAQRKSANTEALLEKHKAEHAKLKNASSSLYLDWKSEVISKEDFLHMKGVFDQQIGTLNQQITVLESDIERYEKGVDTEDQMLTAFLENKNIKALSRGALASLVDMILVHESKEITIRFKFANQFERVLEYIRENSAVTGE